jgi:predicted nucleic acid-binding protein
MKTVYIETSIVSYLTARPARDLIAAAWQNATSSWWTTQQQRFELYTSQLVVEEAEQGDHDAAERRLAVLSQLPHLAITDEVTELARALLEAGELPHAATGDAMHVALAAYHEVDYLLTWNCRHIDNAELKPLIRSVCINNGYRDPEICTPLELMGDQDND